MPLCTWERKIRRVLPDRVDKFKILFWTGGVHAIPCERPVHHGRPGLQFYVHPGRSWVHRSRPGEQASDAPTEPHPAVVRGFCGSDHCLLHVQGLHAYQTAVSWTVSFFFTSLSSLTLFVPSNSERVASPSSSNIGAKRSKAGVGQEKPDKNAHISTINIAVLPLLWHSFTLLLPNLFTMKHLSIVHQLYARHHHLWKIYILCFRKLIFLWLSVVFFSIWTSKRRSRKR